MFDRSSSNLLIHTPVNFDDPSIFNAIFCNFSFIIFVCGFHCVNESKDKMIEIFYVPTLMKKNVIQSLKEPL